MSSSSSVPVRGGFPGLAGGACPGRMPRGPLPIRRPALGRLSLSSPRSIVAGVAGSSGFSASHPACGRRVRRGRHAPDASCVSWTPIPLVGVASALSAGKSVETRRAMGSTVTHPRLFEVSETPVGRSRAAFFSVRASTKVARAVCAQLQHAIGWSRHGLLGPRARGRNANRRCDRVIGRLDTSENSCTRPAYPPALVRWSTAARSRVVSNPAVSCEEAVCRVRSRRKAWNQWRP